MRKRIGILTALGLLAGALVFGSVAAPQASYHPAQQVADGPTPTPAPTPTTDPNGSGGGGGHTGG